MPMTMPAIRVPTTDPKPTPLKWRRPMIVPSRMLRNRHSAGKSWRNAASDSIAIRRLLRAVPRCVRIVGGHLSGRGVSAGTEIFLADDAVLIDHERHHAGHVVLRRPGDETEPSRRGEDLEVVAIERRRLIAVRAE